MGVVRRIHPPVHPPSDLGSSVFIGGSSVLPPVYSYSHDLRPSTFIGGQLFFLSVSRLLRF
jgi:hypothetical protein